MALFTLIAEAVQGTIVRTVSVPSRPAGVVRISLVSSVFPTDPTLGFSLMLEESFDSGATWKTSSGFPTASSGGTAGQPARGGGVSTGLAWVEYAFDGRARQLRATMTPTPGPFSWGLTATTP